MAHTREFQCRFFNRHQAVGRNQRKPMRQAYFRTALFLCTAVLLLSGRQTSAQTAVSQVSADWKALGFGNSLRGGQNSFRAPTLSQIFAVPGAYKPAT